MRFAEWGELRFHQWLERRLGSQGEALGVGDDAALLPRSRARLAVTTDAVVEGVHFRRDWFSWSEIGRRATYGCLSDLAAVCARPLAVLLTLGIPDDLSAEAVRGFTGAVAAAAAEFGAALVGGDTTESATFFADLVAIGETRRPWLRTGALPGDVLAVTGALGAPAAAIALLEAGAGRSAGWPHLRRRLVAPRPRIAEALALAQSPIHAAMDLSDGLMLDASRLAAASGVRAIIEAERIPVAEGVPEAARKLGRAVVEFAASGGEEYELLLALPEDGLGQARRRLAPLDCPLTVVGRVEAGRGEARLVDSAGRPVTLPSAGWEHYGGARREG